MISSYTLRQNEQKTDLWICHPCMIVKKNAQRFRGKKEKFPISHWFCSEGCIVVQLLVYSKIELGGGASATEPF